MNKFKKPLNIVIVESLVIDDPKGLHSFLSDFSKIKSDKILIHENSKSAFSYIEKTEMSNIHNEDKQIIEDKRLDINVMINTGLINKKIVSQLQCLKCNAIGLSGVDANMFYTRKMENLQEVNKSILDIEYINSPLIAHLLTLEITPVFSTITHDRNAQLFLASADSIAKELAKAFAENYAINLIYSAELNTVI